MGDEIPYGPDRKLWREELSPWAVSGDKLLVSPPSRDPTKMKAYPHQRGTTPTFYQVPSKGLDDKQCEQAQSETAKRTAVQTENFLGYQNTMGNNYDVVSSYLSSSVNNLGDPFIPGNYTMNFKWMERNVLDYFASLWNAKWPHDPNDPDTYWGYVLTMGSSEGNLYGIWNARDYLQGKLMMTDVSKDTSESTTYYVQVKPEEHNPHAFTPVAFYSEDTHYSVVKAMSVLEIKTFYELGTELYPDSCPIGPEWPEEVPSKDGQEGPGTVDIPKLCKLVEFFAEKGYPPIVVFNCGTTFKGAYDDVKTGGESLMPILDRYGLKDREFQVRDANGTTITVRRKGYWIHVDGALGASYMPFIRMAFEKLKTRSIDTKLVPPEPFDFQLPFVCSLVTSGHKFPGAPWPTGVYMTKTGLQLLPPEGAGEEVEVIGSLDTTFAGSRNGLSSLVLWTYISTHNYDAQVDKVLRCLTLSVYAEAQLKEVETERKAKGWDPQDLWVVRSPLAMSVRFRKPNDNIVYKYSLANETYMYSGEKRTYTHIYIMGFTTKEKLDELFRDLRTRLAFEVEKPVVQLQQRQERKIERQEAQPARLHLETKKLFKWPRGSRGYR